MQKVINGVKYTSRAESTSRLISIPKEGQTPLAESQASIDARNYPLSERNGANAYIIPTDKEKVLLNFIAQKVFVSDHDIMEVLNPQFEYFVPDAPPEPETYELEDGIIFRCVRESSVPLPKELYEYYIMMDGVGRRIPDYKTLEVMLAERGQSLLSVRVLEKSQCDLIPHHDGASLESKADSWTEEYADQTDFEVLEALSNSVLSANAMVEALTAQATEQVSEAIAQEEAATATAQAAQQQAVASQLAANATIAQANAAIATAEQAKAEAEAAKAEAEAAKAEAEASMGSEE